MHILQFSISLIFFFCFSDLGDAQTTNFGGNYISDLKGGTLIVRLPTNAKAIEHYESKGNTKKADELRKTTAELNREIYRAFNFEYKFSKMRFIYGDDLNKEDSFVFLNENLEIDKSISLETENYFFLDLSEYQEYRNRAYILTQDFERIPKPFPNGNISRLKIGFAGLRSDKDKLNQIAFKLNQRLEKG